MLTFLLLIFSNTFTCICFFTFETVNFSLRAMIYVKEDRFLLILKKKNVCSNNVLTRDRIQIDVT
jgi:hypothetical protein